MPNKKQVEVKETPEYHNTYLLLKKYRDVVWNLELSVQRVRNKFRIEMGSSIEDFLESAYIAGLDFSASGLTEYTKSIEESQQMLRLIESAVEMLRYKHKNGEMYYWILYYAFLSPQQYKNAGEIIEQLLPHISDISYRTYYRKRRDAISSLSCILWGYTERESLEVTKKFLQNK